MIEDACQVAWTTLLRRPDITLDARGFGWLTTVAIREAWRLGSTRNEQPVGPFISPSDLQHVDGELPEPADHENRSTEEKALDRIEHGERLQAMRTLKPSEREALYRTIGLHLDTRRAGYAPPKQRAARSTGGVAARRSARTPKSARVPLVSKEQSCAATTPSA